MKEALYSTFRSIDDADSARDSAGRFLAELGSSRVISVTERHVQTGTFSSYFEVCVWYWGK